MTWMRRTGAKRIRSTKYLNPEKSGIVRQQFVKHVTRLSLPPAAGVPIPTSSINLPTGTMTNVFRIVPSIFNPFPDTLLDYAINNYTLYTTMYTKYVMKGMKVSIEVQLFTSGLSFGNIYLYARRLGETSPTRMEEVMTHKYIKRKHYSLSVQEPSKTYKMNLYMTIGKFQQRKYDPSLDDRDVQDDAASGDVGQDNYFEFACLIDNNGAAQAQARVNVVGTFWIHWKKPVNFDYVA